MRNEPAGDCSEGRSESSPPPHAWKYEQVVLQFGPDGIERNFVIIAATSDVRVGCLEFPVPDDVNPFDNQTPKNDVGF